MASGDKIRIGPPNLKDKKNFSDLGSTDTAVRFADVDEDTRLLKSEGAVPLQRDDDNDDDGFVSQNHRQFCGRRIRRIIPRGSSTCSVWPQKQQDDYVLGVTNRRSDSCSVGAFRTKKNGASTKTWRQRRQQNGVKENVDETASTITSARQRQRNVNEMRRQRDAASARCGANAMQRQRDATSAEYRLGCSVGRASTQRRR